jgi:phage-related minor tail protein
VAGKPRPIVVEVTSTADFSDATKDARRAFDQIGDAAQDGADRVEDATDQTADELDKLRRRAANAARDLKSLLGDAAGEIPDDFKQAAKQVDGQFDDMESSAESASEGITDRFRGLGQRIGDGFDGADIGGRMSSAATAGLAGLATVALAAGAAAAAAFSQAFEDAVEFEGVEDKASAALRLTGPDAAALASEIREAYTAGVGESFGDVGEIITGLASEGLVDSSDDVASTYAGLVEALGVTFNQDFEEIIRAASALVANDLVPSTEAAFDLLATGFQEGGLRADDLAEVFGQYSNQFADLGISGEESLGLIVSALDAGARSSDGAADAVKEAFLRITEGSEPVSDALADIGLDIGDLQDLINDGRGFEAMQILGDAIGDVGSETEAAEAAQAILGGTYEQVGLDGVAAWGDAAGAIEDVDGRAGELADTLNDNLGTKIDSFKRTVQVGLVDLFEDYALPVLEEAGALGADLFADLQSGPGTPLGDLGVALGELKVLVVDEILPAFEEHWPEIKTTIESVMEGSAEAITAFIDAINAAWEVGGEEFVLLVSAAFVGIGVVIDVALALITASMDAFTAILTADWAGLWDSAGDKVSSALSWIQGQWNAFLGWLTAIPGKVSRLLSGLWDGLTDGLTDKINSAIGKINSLISAANVLPGINIPSVGGVGPSKTRGGSGLRRAATGDVLFEEAVRVVGDNSGARNDPELIAPQSYIRDALRDVLAETGGGRGGALIENATIMVAPGENILDAINHAALLYGVAA